MTAFARQDKKQSYGTISWELRSVNHRYLEIFMRLAEDFRSKEIDIRSLIAKHLSRGKLECTLDFKPTAAENSKHSLNQELTAQIVSLSAEVKGKSPDSQTLSVSEILRWPGVLQTPTVDLAEIENDLFSVLEHALTELVETRIREGEKLAIAIEERRLAMLDIVTELRKHMPETLQWLRERLAKRFEEISIQVDESRLEQEMVLVAQKTDVEEELKRLETHLEEVGRILQNKDQKPVGRRLDFLMQELNREANTLCSKSMNTETTAFGVELKVLIEQMREQIQNIE